MVGAAAAPQRRVVHGGQVVEDQRRRVDQLDRGRDRDGAFGGTAAELGAQHHEDAAHLLRRRQCRVRHRPIDAGVARRKQRGQFRRDARLVAREEGRQADHFGAADAGPKVSMY